MDISLLVKILAPCLPFLMTVGNKTVESASQEVGEDIWNKAKAIWAKLKPKVEKKPIAKAAAQELATSPDDSDALDTLGKQLKKILAADAELADEIAKILQETATKPDNSSSSVAAQSYDESVQINTGRDVNQPEYIFGEKK